MRKALRKATDSINTEYRQKGRYLHYEYDDNATTLFGNTILDERYNQYVKEVNRLRADGLPVTCEITDYINYELIDDTINKNLLNQVSGTMTGLGILGTFVGLSFGLQAFNTGTAEEITNSIPKLMDGIKVAFHTSIYGMIFSLVFNYVYKKTLQDIYEEMQLFLEAYEKYVSPNSENDSMSQMLRQQNEQTEFMGEMTKYISQVFLEQLNKILIPELQAIRLNTDSLSKDLVEKMSDAIVPEFKKVNEKFDKFVDASTTNQVQGISTMVNSFVESMNAAVNTNFSELNKSLERTTKVQNEQSEYLENVLQRVGELTIDLKSLNEISAHTITATNEIVQKINSVSETIRDWAKNASDQFAVNNELLSNHGKTVEEIAKYHETVAGNTKEMLLRLVIRR